MHKIIDLRLTGLNKDRKLQEKIESEKRLVKKDKRICHELSHNKVIIMDLKKEIDQLTKSRNKYKEYWMAMEQKEKMSRKLERSSAGNAGYTSRKTRENVEADEIQTVEMETKAEVKRHKNGRKIIVEK